MGVEQSLMACFKYSLVLQKAQEGNDMAIYKTRQFDRRAGKQGINTRALSKAVRKMYEELQHADLVGWL